MTVYTKLITPSAAPHRGNANRPLAIQGKANTLRTLTKSAAQAKALRTLTMPPQKAKKPSNLIPNPNPTPMPSGNKHRRRRILHQNKLPTAHIPPIRLQQKFLDMRSSRNPSTIIEHPPIPAIRHIPDHVLALRQGKLQIMRRQIPTHINSSTKCHAWIKPE